MFKKLFLFVGLFVLVGSISGCSNPIHKITLDACKYGYFSALLHVSATNELNSARDAEEFIKQAEIDCQKLVESL